MSAVSKITETVFYVQRGIKLIPQLEALEVQYQVIGNRQALARKVKTACV